MMRERVLRSLRITRGYVHPDQAILLLGAAPAFRAAPARIAGRGMRATAAAGRPH